MDNYSAVELFSMIFVTMGPIKVLVTFAEKSAKLDSALRRRIALKAVAAATVVGLLFVFFGSALMLVFKFSPVAMKLAGGLILLIYAIRSILAEGKSHAKAYATDREAEQMAIYPLAVPLMASPMGLVTLTVASATPEITTDDIMILAGMLLVVMFINLIALLSVDRVIKFLPSDVLAVANRILSLLLAALAMQTLIDGADSLFQSALEQIKDALSA